MNQLILCADDFAYSREISETIADLAGQGRLNAISCMAVMPGWPRDAALLKGLGTRVQIGLHLVLTGEVPLTGDPALTGPDGLMPPINTLARMARLRQLSLGAVQREVQAQFARFIDAMGRAPDFVDGHQHAHLLGGIRRIVLAETATHAPHAWLRDCTDSVAGICARPFAWKALGSALHSRGLSRQAQEFRLGTNTGFAGHYDFAGDYEALFAKFLSRAGARHLVMCHPGDGWKDGDDIAGARIVEAEVLRRMPIADIARAHGLAFAA